MFIRFCESWVSGCYRRLPRPILTLPAGTGLPSGRLALLVLNELQRDLLDIGVDPLGHALLLLQRFFEQPAGFAGAGRTTQRQQRLVGGDLEILERIVGKGVLQDLVA